MNWEWWGDCHLRANIFKAVLPASSNRVWLIHKFKVLSSLSNIVDVKHWIFTFMLFEMTFVTLSQKHLTTGHSHVLWRTWFRGHSWGNFIVKSWFGFKYSLWTNLKLTNWWFGLQDAKVIFSIFCYCRMFIIHFKAKKLVRYSKPLLCSFHFHRYSDSHQSSTLLHAGKRRDFSLIQCLRVNQSSHPPSPLLSS